MYAQLLYPYKAPLLIIPCKLENCSQFFYNLESRFPPFSFAPIVKNTVLLVENSVDTWGKKNCKFAFLPTCAG
jgi:hypothetical protein